MPGSGAPFFGYQDLGIVTSDWKIQTAADFNGDAKSDILWRNNNGDVFLWNSTPGSGAPFFSYQDLGIVTSDWKIQTAADFNDDAKADILWRNTNGDTFLWASNATGTPSFAFYDLGIVGTGWHL